MFSEAELRMLPWPSSEQQRTFVAHLRDVHSWYKHLPLLRGGTFVVFVVPDAGQDYPTLHPSLPYGNTVTGYHRAFGYLSYMWSSDGTHFSRDGGSPLLLPSTLMEQCQFVLYPYVSNEFYWQVHHADVALLRAGTPHPERRRLLAWEATAQALERAEDTGADVSAQMQLIDEINRFAVPLQIQEVQRIEQALHRLYHWHSGT